jgi:hypothetical protein
MGNSEEADILLAAQEKAEAVLQGGQQKPEELLLVARPSESCWRRS